MCMRSLLWKLLFMLIPSNSHRGRKTRDSIYSGLVNFVYAKSQRNSGAADIKMRVKHVIPACIIIFKLKSDENSACVSQHSKYLYLHLILRLSEFFSPACEKRKTHLFITFTFCVLCKLVNQHSRFLLKERRKKIDFINTKHSCDWLNTISSERWHQSCDECNCTRPAFLGPICLFVHTFIQSLIRHTHCLLVDVFRPGSELGIEPPTSVDDLFSCSHYTRSITNAIIIIIIINRKQMGKL